ncbi:MgtC/SapB family protein [Aliiroseovarius marinus]|uniref:MgtC/SapB family protein n=1 Tax=Aliiroseovarius marinus TaxID=2500159 RepID=UPI00105C21A5|nr:MgtC/SapB family protein [Aliiroseovarius marinus]
MTPEAITLDVAAINLTAAVIFGALVGSERQVRQRMAGLRTNALVSLGAAGFVVFAALFPHEVSPTRVAAQVVSGIGFLGAGIIFRHGFTVHGLNTAATLWCSAAIGVMAGVGAIGFAALMCGLIIFVNLGLRPLVKFLKRKTRAGQPLLLEFRLWISCRAKHENKVRSTIVHKLALPGLALVSIDATDSGEDSTLEVLVNVEDNSDSLIKTAVAPLMLDPNIRSLSWEAANDD